MTEQTTPNQRSLGDELIALGEHLNVFPLLPTVYAVLGSQLDAACSVRLLIGNAGKATGGMQLAAWAATMSEVQSHADRFAEDSVDGHVIGWIGDRKFDVHGSLDPDAFPEDNGKYEWDVTALLQEA
jgi:hypothetical protein